MTHRLVAAVSLLALAAACGSEPTPTPTPTPTSTPTPTATPTPAPTPLPEVSVNDFTIMESTTGADVMALLSEPEIACVSAEMDPQAAQALLNVPLLENLDLVYDIPLECIETGKAITLLVAVHEAEAGGLSAETKACLRDLYAKSPWMLGSEEVEEVTSEVATSLFGFYLCFSDEEAAAMPADEEMPFKPSELRCVMEEFGGVEKFAASIESDSQDFDLTYDFMAAAYTCGTNLGLGQPSPTAAPTPLPPTVTPTPAPDGSATRPDSSLGSFTITGETTGHDLLAALSEPEAECVRTSRSHWVVGTGMDDPLVEWITLYGAGYFPFTCLTPGSMADLGIGVVGARAGGLSPATLSCLDEYFAGNPVIPEPERTLWKEQGPFTQNFIVCLTDEENAAQEDEAGNPPPPQLNPSFIRCTLEQPGVMEAWEAWAARVNAGDESPPDADMQQVFLTAGYACGGGG